MMQISMERTWKPPGLGFPPTSLNFQIKLMSRDGTKREVKMPETVSVRKTSQLYSVLVIAFMLPYLREKCRT
jgi:hypothetical protein